MADAERRYPPWVPGVADGQLSLTLAGNLGSDATIPRGDPSPDPHGRRAAPGWRSCSIGEVPVPVERKLYLDVSIVASGPVQVHASGLGSRSPGERTYTAAMGPRSSSVKPSANGWVHANGATLTLGPVMQVGLGLERLNAHIQDALDVTAKISPSTPCEIDFGGSAGVGIDLGPLAASYSPFDPDVPGPNHCPQTGMGPTSGGKPSVSVTNPGSQTGTVGTPVQPPDPSHRHRRRLPNRQRHPTPRRPLRPPLTGLITGTPMIRRQLNRDGHRYRRKGRIEERHVRSGPSAQAVAAAAASARSPQAAASYVCAAARRPVDRSGENEYGQLGNGTYHDSEVPFAVSGRPTPPLSPPA